MGFRLTHYCNGFSIYIFSFCGFVPRPPPGLCLWGPGPCWGTSVSSPPVLSPSETNFWLRPCKYTDKFEGQLDFGLPLHILGSWPHQGSNPYECSGCRCQNLSIIILASSVQCHGVQHARVTSPPSDSLNGVKSSNIIIVAAIISVYNASLRRDCQRLQLTVIAVCIHRLGDSRDTSCRARNQHTHTIRADVAITFTAESVPALQQLQSNIKFYKLTLKVTLSLPCSRIAK